MTHTAHAKLPSSCYLAGHPDQAFVCKLINSLQFGFDIGFRGKRGSVYTCNRPSALAHPEEVRKYLDKEIERGHTKGPFLNATFSDFVSSPLACIPKKDGSLRLILDLSTPMGQSINDSISAEDFKLTYVKFDSIVKMIASHGKGALLAKVDLKHAFRQCPVRPADWPVYMEGQVLF